MVSLSSSSLSPYYHLIFTALLFLVSVFIFLISHSKSSNTKKAFNLPPGPPGYPVVGNLFQVAHSGKQFFHADLAHEALIEKGQIFATRPGELDKEDFQLQQVHRQCCPGPVWRSLRRNMVQNMLSTVRVKEFCASVRRPWISSFTGSNPTPTTTTEPFGC
ncbi:hypothetical protein OROGR_032092 [Orobanche gracilis]